MSKGRHEKNHSEQTLEILTLLTAVLEALRALPERINDLIEQ